MAKGKSKASRGVVIVTVAPPRWESYKKSIEDKTKTPTLENTSFKNVFIYNFYTQEERRHYNGFGRGGSAPNPTFDFSTLNGIKDATGQPIINDGFYRIASNKVPSFINLSWTYDIASIASAEEINLFKQAVGLTRSTRRAGAGSLAFNSMRSPTSYTSFEEQQNDYVRITNEYLDMFSSMSSTGEPQNDWFAEEIDSTGFTGRQEFLWKNVIGKDQRYKNFLQNRHFSMGTPTDEDRDKYFNNSVKNDSVSVVNVEDSALLENLDFPETDALPEDITIIQNTEFAWKTKSLSQGFSGRILSSQEKIRNSAYWMEFMNKLEIVRGSGDIEQILGSQPGPIESTLIRGKNFRKQRINGAGLGGVSEFKVVGFVIEKEQVVEPGEKDEPGIQSSEKFPLIFVPCYPGNQNENLPPSVPTTYMDAAINYDKEYKYTIRTVLTFDIVVPISSTQSEQRSYFVNSTHSNVLRVQTREARPPSYPRDLSAFYEYYKSGLTLNWAFPVNPQRDTAYFAIFRRDSIYEPFKLLQIYDFNYSISDPQQSVEEIKALLVHEDYDMPADNLDEDLGNRYNLVKRMTNKDSNTTYTDIYFKHNRDYIYTICAIDAHGQMSNYSSQIKVNLDSRTHKLNVRQISPPGAPLVFPNWFIQSKAFLDVARTARYRRAVVKFRPDYKKVKIGPGNGELRDVVVTTDKNNGGNSQNSYYLQIMNPDRKDDIVLRYQVDDSSSFNLSQFEEIKEIAELAGLPEGSIERDE